MRSLRAFVLGGLAFGILAYSLAAALAIVAQARGWNDFHIGIGPLVLVAVEQSAGVTVTTLGVGIAAVAVLGGAVNAALAALLARKGASGTERGMP